jgi:GcrA cell cycle regulator
MKWTQAEIEQVFALKAEGKSFSEIGALMGKKRLACLGVYHREQVRRGHVPIKREGLSPELRRNTTPKRVYRPKIAPPALPATGVGFLLPALAIVPQQRGPAVGILDVTGCKWPVGADSGVAGSHTFCNCPKKPGKPYCAEHAARARSTLPVSTWLKRAAA